MKRVLVGIFLLSTAFFVGRPRLQAADAETLPPPADRAVDFHKDILAILANSCAKCHAGGQRKGGLSIDTRESLLAGGESGPVVTPGKSGESRLVALIAGLEPDAIMPAQGPRLSSQQVGMLRAWIDQGLPWEQGFSFKKTLPAPLAPRRVTLPPIAAGAAATNPIDRLLEVYFQSTGFVPGAVVDDRTFMRRASMDLVGLMPLPPDVDALVRDTAPDKRPKIIRALLDNNQQYATHWLTFWNDALRNDYRGTGYIDGGRLQITDWLAAALVENMPYDRFVRELINPTPQAAGFIKGIVWRGVVNASQAPPMQAAQNVSQVFLGINLKCASCHDSFISAWKLTDAYGLAGIFADGPLEMHRCDQPTGQFAPLQFLYPSLGSIDSNAPTAERLKQLSEVITRPENGRLARTIVNRLWARLLGRGLVEPVDEMDNPPWSADLLDFLAADLVDHGYDFKHTIELIVNSRAYQLSPVDLADDHRHDFSFRGPLVRRMSAEQFVDAVADLAGVDYAAAAAKPEALASHQSPSGRAGVRAALVFADPLLVALGRSNREQVVTDRPRTATTLQALELTNGTPLATLLEKGSGQWSARKLEPPALVAAIYQVALLRLPSDGESTLALELLGSEPGTDEIEDLLWAIVMLPEFQLIY
jgi:hypothetical protein